MSGNPLFTSFSVLYFSTLDINVTHSTCLVQGNKSTIKETPSPLRCQYPSSFATGISAGQFCRPPHPDQPLQK
jgi:hypothetical protein